jgi:hypothetical protein
MLLLLTYIWANYLIDWGQEPHLGQVYNGIAETQGKDSANKSFSVRQSTILANALCG